MSASDFEAENAARLLEGVGASLSVTIALLERMGERTRAGLIARHARELAVFQQELDALALELLDKELAAGGGR